MLHLDIDADQLGQISRDLAGTERQVRAALDSTLGRMALWLRTKSLRELSPHLQVQQKLLRRRLKSFRLRRNAAGSEISVWYGLNPIGLIYMGARQTKQGVSAGKHKVASAFIAPGRGGRGKQVFKRIGQARLPIEKQEFPIQDKAQTYIEDNLLGTEEFNEKFFTEFERQLSWRTRKQR